MNNTTCVAQLENSSLSGLRKSWSDFAASDRHKHTNALLLAVNVVERIYLYLHVKLNQASGSTWAWITHEVLRMFCTANIK